MLTKSQAQALITTFNSGFLQRLSATIDSNAAAGFLGVSTYPYPPTTPAQTVTNVTNYLQSLGWTVTVDGVNFTVTLS